MTAPAFLTVALAAGLGVALAVTLIRQRYLVITVEGTSMTPTLVEGDRVLVRRALLAQVAAGDLVVATSPTGGRWAGMPLPEWLIKRAAAVQGEPVPRLDAPALRALPEDTVPVGCVVLVGDNPEESLDSRACGYFRDEQIVGVVVRQLPGVKPQPSSSPASPRPTIIHPKDTTSWRI
ncbi:signal peptidase I [Streptomyces sparsogenes]|uniref:signal peptidase I n=1 Tax=Streptomyces sparsogenes TaxID=67365 RepID=UPI0033ED9A71